MKDRDEKSSLRKQLAQLREKGLIPAGQLRQTIEEASQIAASREDVQFFFQAVENATTAGIFNDAQEMPRREAVDQWRALPWKAWLERVRELAESNPIAKESLGVINAFEENSLLLGQLTRVFEIFLRPCRKIWTKKELVDFLEGLVTQGLAEKNSSPPKGRKAIHCDDSWYAPKQGVALARMGWVFPVRAVIRLKRLETEERNVLGRIQPLLDLATMPSEPEEGGLNRILRGGSGALAVWMPKFFWSGDNQGLFALALEGCQNDFMIPPSGVIADFPFGLSEQLEKEEYVLPKLRTEETADGLQVRFGRLPRLAQKEYIALRQAERLIQLRLNQENRLAAQVTDEVEPVT